MMDDPEKSNQVTILKPQNLVDRQPNGAINLWVGDEWRNLRTIAQQSVRTLLDGGISDGYQLLTELAQAGLVTNADLALTGVTLDGLARLAENPATAINDGYCLNCFEDQVDGLRPFCSAYCENQFKAETLAWASGDGFYYLNKSAY